VRAALPDLDEPQGLKKSDHLSRLEDWDVAQLRNLNRVYSYELGL
jgi:hypothetical protein